MRIVVLPGDGIGPEFTAATLDVLKTASERFQLGDVSGIRRGRQDQDRRRGDAARRLMALMDKFPDFEIVEPKRTAVA